mgnify:FL=1
MCIVVYISSPIAIERIHGTKVSKDNPLVGAVPRKWYSLVEHARQTIAPIRQFARFDQRILETAGKNI